MAPSPSRGDPDKLLEDIIREIVGDAAAETASSLQQPRVQPESAPPGEPVPAHRAVGPAEQFDHGVRLVSPDHSDATGPGTGENGVSGNEVASVTPIPAADVAPSVSTPPIGDAAQPRPASTTSVEPSPSAAPEVVAPRFDTTRLDPDVSRETRQITEELPWLIELADETRRRIALEQAVLPLPPATRVLTISNQKGGVGKTTTAVNLAASMAPVGARVLVIDLDPQGNASTALGVEHRPTYRASTTCSIDEFPLADVVQTAPNRTSCSTASPATIHLAGAEIELVSLVAREQRLRTALERYLAAIGAPYDYVFIDCPPSLGLLTINAFVAAREVLIPIQCEYYALEGLSQLLSNIELIQKHLNPTCASRRSCSRCTTRRTNLAQQVARRGARPLPRTQMLDTVIPRSVRVSEAPSYGQSVISYDCGSRAGRCRYREAAAEIARRGAAEHRRSPTDGHEANRSRPRDRRPHPDATRTASSDRPVDVFFPDVGLGTDSRRSRRSSSAASAEGLITVPGAHLVHLDPDDIVPNAAAAAHATSTPTTSPSSCTASASSVCCSPIVVRPHPDRRGKYELVMGERRLRATKDAGLDTIPAVVKDTADEAHAARRAAREPAPLAAQPARRGVGLPAAARRLRHHAGGARDAHRPLAPADQQHASGC